MNKPFYRRWGFWPPNGPLIISFLLLIIAFLMWQDTRRFRKVDVEPEFTISAYLPTHKIKGRSAPFCTVTNNGRIAATHMQFKAHRLIYQTNGKLNQRSVGTFSSFPLFEPFHSEHFGMLSAYLTDSDIASIQDKATDSLILVISISYTREADARRFKKAAIYLLSDSEEWVRNNHPSLDEGRVANIREKVLDYLAKEKDEFGVDLLDVPLIN